jgi:hypothetical protein
MRSEPLQGSKPMICMSGTNVLRECELPGAPASPLRHATTAADI